MNLILTAIGVYAFLVILCYAARWISEEDKRSQNRPIRIGNFERFTFPIIRRIWPSLIAHDLVTVQPMTEQAGVWLRMPNYYGDGRSRRKGPFVPKWKRDEVSKQISKVEQQICNAWEI